MLEIVALYFLCKKNGALAIQKGLPKGTWQFYTIMAWICAEMIGVSMGIAMFGTKNLFGILGMGIFCAFGGYLIVKYLLENKPDTLDDDIKSIGIDDLRPPPRK
jgi:hypothetical protein